MDEVSCYHLSAFKLRLYYLVTNFTTFKMVFKEGANTSVENNRDILKLFKPPFYANNPATLL